MEPGTGELWLNTGITAAHMLATHQDKSLVYEHVGQYLLTVLRQAQVTDLCLFVRDETKDFFRCEVICDDMSIRQGFDLVPVAQVENTLSGQDELYQMPLYEYYYYVLLPLRYDSSFVGFLEFHCSHPIDEEEKRYLMSFRNALAMGIQHYILSQRSKQDQYAIDMVTEVTRQLHHFSSIRDITTSFAHVVLKSMRFDRVTLFLFDENKKVNFSYCVDANGKEYELEAIPDIPDTDELQPLDQLSGYWFPLATSTAKVGMALFDNVFSSYPFPIRNLDVLNSICHQFATAVVNISLFNNVQFVAQHDKLTNLYNRAYFEESLARVDCSQYLPLSIINGDVNGLKATNDVFGHFEGDRLLLRIAGLIREACRPEDIIARWGGDEFIILLPNTGEAEAEAICKKLNDSLRSTESSLIQLSMSLGYATKVNENEDLVQVMKKAEDMMYANKQIDRDVFKKNFMTSISRYLNDYCLETEEHLLGIKDLALKFSIILGLSDYERENLQLAALYHDVGKIAIDPAILNKPGKLSPEDWEVMKKHPAIGARIAQTSLGLPNIAHEILSHHERWDGSGYPYGKKGYDIPKLSRILAIVDAYDVMTHDRPYKKAISHQEALAALKAQAGIQFDPALVNTFCISFEKGPGTRA